MIAERGTELFSANVADVEGRIVVFATGELDASTVGVLTRALAGPIDGGTPVICLDLAKVSFIGAAGVNAILAAHRAMASQGRTLIVRSPGSLTMRVFTACGVSKSLNLERQPLGR